MGIRSSVNTKPFLIATVVIIVLALVARAVPHSAGTGGSGAGRAAVERWRADQAAVYRNLRRLVLADEIKTGDDVRRYFAFCRGKVEPNAAGPLGPELGQIVGKKFDKERVANAAARLESEFAP
jgi:hypothetical protein